MTRDRRTAVAVLATVAIVIGIAGFINALDAPSFTSGFDAQLWRLVSMSRLAAVVTLVGGVVAISSVLSGKRGPAALAGLLFMGAAGFTLVAVGRSFNWLAGRASTLSFWLMLGIGLLTLVFSPELPANDPSPGRGPAPREANDDDA